MSKKIDRQALLTAVESCTGLTESQRADLHQLLTETPKYGLVWEDTPEEVYDELKEEIPVMNEDRSKAIVNGNEYPNHVIIEGDNLHALTDLCYTHAGKIDVIYIDPPYNTGNKDFVYNDSFVDRDNGFRHSMWLSFMDKRLRLLSELISDDGTLFISIDENEHAPLKMLCDEILGEENFVCDLIWQSTPGSNTGTDIKTVTESVLMYSKRRSEEHINSKPIDDAKKYKNQDNHLAERGPYVTNKLDRRMTGSHYSEALNYAITMPDGTQLYPGGETFRQDHWNWRWSQQKVEWGIANDFLLFSKKKDKWAIYFKQYLNVDNNNKPIERSIPYQNLILEDSMSSARGTKEVMDIFNSKKFDYPKPLALIKYIIRMVSKPNSIIFDAFAGSGTTLHATMELNKEDGGHRQCILVTNNENKICEEVTYPRNKKVIEGYDTPKGEHVEGLHDNNLRYFKMDSVSRIPSMRNRRKLAAHMVDMLRIKHNIYTRKNQIGSYSIDTATMRYYEDNGRRLLIIMMPTEIYRVIEAIQALPPIDEKINVYVYSDGPYAYEDDFTAVADRVNVIALPGPMLKTFHRIAPKMNDVQVVEPDRELTEGEADDTSNDFNDGEE